MIESVGYKSMVIQKIRKKLLYCTELESESLFQKMADDFEDDLLEYDGFPEEHFDFFLRLLSDSKLMNKKGVWNFLLAMGTESHRLTSDHYKRISSAISENYQSYEDEDMCLAVCDFIARNYEYSEAKSLLKFLNEIENKMSIGGFAGDGLLIAEFEKERLDAEKN